MGRGGQVASFEALTQGDDLEANNPAPNGLALGNEQALCAYADRAVAVTQQAGGEAHTTGRDGRLRLQAYPLADPQTVKLRDVATLVGAAALGGNLREAPRIPTR